MNESMDTMEMISEVEAYVRKAFNEIKKDDERFAEIKYIQSKSKRKCHMNMRAERVAGEVVFTYKLFMAAYPIVKAHESNMALEYITVKERVSDLVDFDSMDLEQSARVVLLHELAHALVYFDIVKAFRNTGDIVDFKSHGRRFIAYYRQLIKRYYVSEFQLKAASKEIKEDDEKKEYQIRVYTTVKGDPKGNRHTFKKIKAQTRKEAVYFFMAGYPKYAKAFENIIWKADKMKATDNNITYTFTITKIS